MTDEEHIARAMLMGRIYIEWARVYVYKDEWEAVDMHTPASWLDAETLEEMDAKQKMERLTSQTDMPSAIQSVEFSDVNMARAFLKALYESDWP